MTQVRHFGAGAIGRVSEVLAPWAPRRVFLVTGKASFPSSGAEGKLLPQLGRMEVCRHHDFTQNPRFEDVQTGIAHLRSFSPDVVIAVGGGTVLDMAKLVNALAAQTGEAEEYVTGHSPVEVPGKPLVAIPTTAGSGSEATSFAVVYKDRRKFSVAHPTLLPTAAFLDAELTMTLPPALTATTGMDALSQAVESYWSVNSTAESTADAGAAIREICASLPGAVHQPTAAFRSAMMLAAHQAGRAINVTKTTAPHALSYGMTAWFGVPHGQAVALTLPEFLVFNAEVTEADVADGRGVAHVRRALADIVALLGCRDPYDCRSHMKKMMAEIGLGTTLRDVGITTHEQRALLLDYVNLDRLVNNPRRITREQVERMLAAL